MTNRSVAVRLLADVAQYKQAMREAQAATQGVGKQTEDSAKKQRQALNNMGRNATVAGLGLAAGVGLVVKTFADFDKQMSGVGAVANASAADMDRLRQAAIVAGRDTVFSASDAAKAEAELAKAGVSVKDILGGGLTGSLSLAAAGQLDLADAATIAAQSMNIFKLGGDQVGHIADVLAAGANKSAADVGQLGDALRQGGLLAAQTGLSLEDTVAALSAFADNALIGSDAGTSLKTMLQRLVPQTTEARDAMKKYGISAYDAQGKFVGLTEYAGRLQNGLKGLTDEQRNATMATIFGSDAVRAANVLYSLGAKGVRDYEQAVNDQGAASRMAGRQLDNLRGDIEQLKGSLETAFIKAGEQSNGVLRSMTQHATDAVNAFSELPGAVQGTALAVAGASAGFLLLAPRVVATKNAMTELGLTTGRTGTALSLLGKAGAYVGTFYAIAQGISAIEGAASGGAPNIDSLRLSLVTLAQTGQVSGAAARAFGDDFSHLKETLDLASDNGINIGFARLHLNTLRSGNDFSQARDAVSALDRALSAMVGNGNAKEAASAFKSISDEARAQGVSVDKLNKLFPQYQGALDGVAADAKSAAGGTKALGDAAGKAAPQVVELTDAQVALQKVLDGFVTASGVYQKVQQDDTKAAQDAAQKQSDAQNKSVDAQIDAVNKNADARIAALRKQKGDHDAAISAVEDERDKTVNALRDQKKSWQDYSTDVHVSVQQYLDELDRQVRAQEEWERNLLILAGRVSSGTLQQLAAMGAEGAPLVAEFVHASDAELQRLDELFARDTKNASDAVTQTLTDAAPVIAAAAAKGGQAAAVATATAIANGTSTIAAEAKKWGVAISTSTQAGVKPVEVPVKFTHGGHQFEFDLDANKLAGGNVSFTITPSASTTAGTKRAMGGRVDPYHSYVVGEQRPEVFVPDVPGYIVPSVQQYSTMTAESGRASAATTTGGDTYVVHAYQGPREDAATSVPRALREARFLRGGGF